MTFNIREIAVTHTYYYSPSEYLEDCELNGLTPSPQGFGDYILREIQDDFPKSDWHPSRFITTDSPQLIVPDDQALDAIRNLMSGNEWDSDCIDAVADMIRATGRTIADLP